MTGVRKKLRRNNISSFIFFYYNFFLDVLSICLFLFSEGFPIWRKGMVVGGGGHAPKMFGANSIPPIKHFRQDLEIQSTPNKINKFLKN